MKTSKYSKTWVLVVAARPNFMKVAPLIRAIHAFNEKNSERIQPLLVHTGQHYDMYMSGSFFKDLDLPEPYIYLGVGSGSHGEQTGKILIEFEKVLSSVKPDLVIVVGDVNSTLACALATVKLHIPVAHVEAGLRSFDRRMPEEINRILTDAISDYLFTPSPDGDDNLMKEGIPRNKIYLVGDTMIDSLLFNLEKAKQTDVLKRLGLQLQSYYSSPVNHQSSTITPYSLLTLHRPSNVDDKGAFLKIIKGLREVAVRIPIIFPVHPRTAKQIKAFNMENGFIFHTTPELKPEAYVEKGILVDKIHCFEPFGYLDFLNLMANAKVVFTDSGGIQEETTVLDIPCITLRDTTERPITVTDGTNVVVHNDPKRIVRAANDTLDGMRKQGRCPEIWDGKAAMRIVRILAERSAGGSVG